MPMPIAMVTTTRSEKRHLSVSERDASFTS